jgi:hypothetical protein
MADIYSEDSYARWVSFLADSNNAMLSVLLCYYDEEHKDVRYLLNGRPLDASDLEHDQCKPYLILRLKSPICMQVEQPACSATDSHPVKPDIPVLKVDSRLMAVFDNEEDFHSIVGENEIGIPCQFALEHERERCVDDDEMIRRTRCVRIDTARFAGGAMDIDGSSSAPSAQDSRVATARGMRTSSTSSEADVAVAAKPIQDEEVARHTERGRERAKPRWIEKLWKPFRNGGDMSNGTQSDTTCGQEVMQPEAKRTRTS